MSRMGRGTPSNHNSTHPTLPSSGLRWRRILIHSLHDSAVAPGNRPAAAVAGPLRSTHPGGDAIPAGANRPDTPAQMGRPVVGGFGRCAVSGGFTERLLIEGSMRQFVE
jgi:hypothetical protein